MPFDSTGFEIAPQVVTEPWRKVLLDAADYIEAHGWCQNSLDTSDGRVCLVGAIKIAAGMPLNAGQWNLYPNTLYAVEKIGRYLRSGLQGAAGWNDREGRTAAEVCAALRSCASA